MYGVCITVLASVPVGLPWSKQAIAWGERSFFNVLEKVSSTYSTYLYVMAILFCLPTSYILSRLSALVLTACDFPRSLYPRIITSTRYLDNMISYLPLVKHVHSNILSACYLNFPIEYVSSFYSGGLIINKNSLQKQAP